MLRGPGDRLGDELDSDRADAARRGGARAGKDRTGWAAAALLTLLGVPTKAVMADYLRTNDYVLPKFQRTIEAFVAGGGDRSIALAVLGVKPAYLEASFDEMRKDYGTIENDFDKALGTDAAGQQALRGRFIAGWRRAAHGSSVSLQQPRRE